MARQNKWEEGFVTLAHGSFAKKQVSVFPGFSRLAANRSVESLIEQQWQNALADSQQRGFALFSSEVLLRLDRAETKGDRLNLWVGLTNYKELVGTNLNLGAIRAVTQDPELFLSNALGVCVSVITSDHFILLMRRSERVMQHPGKLHVPGGHPNVKSNTKFDAGLLFDAIVDELREETGIGPTHFTAKPTCLGIVRDRRTLKPEMLFEVQLSISRADVCDMVSAIKSDECSEILFVAREAQAIIDFVGSYGDDMVPVGLACIMYSVNLSTLALPK